METIPTKLPTIMKALSDENRLKILAMLGKGSLCACEMLANLQIRKSTLSHHMSILSEAGLVSSWSVGKWTHYHLCALREQPRALGGADEKAPVVLARPARQAASP